MSYLTKDINKFAICNKLITRGAPNSSSARYTNPKVLGLTLDINPTEFEPSDIVGVSVNGNRPNRVSFDHDLVELAVLSGAKIVKDNRANTSRSFNIGERELSSFLITLGATLIEDSSTRAVWQLQ